MKTSRTGRNSILDAQFASYASERKPRSHANYASYISDGGWHATRSQMEKTLSLAGVPRKTIDMIPGIVDTCRECRAWAMPKADIVPAVELVTAQNDTIETDLMFYKASPA